jgi:predicted deacetylase
VLDAITAVASVPVTLLVVPDYHGTGLRQTRARYLDALGARLARGDELALHGWTHRDEMPLGWNPIDWFRRTRLTRREAEFSALDPAQARRRLRAGCAWFEENGWPLEGFVPPAWLMGRGAWEALAESPFRYTATRTTLVLLPERLAVRAPALVYSARSAWRRAVSRKVVEHQLRRAARSHFVRLALHPVDAHPSLVRHWQDVLATLAATRQAITKSQMAELGRWRATGLPVQR